MRLEPYDLDLIVQSDNLITSDKFLAGALTNNYNFIKRDFIFRPGRYRGKIVYPIWANPIKYIHTPLVVGASDLATGFEEIQSLKRLRIGSIFGTNLLNIPNISTSIPLGLTNNTEESDAHKIFGNVEHLLHANKMSSLREKFDGSIYVNFSIENNFKVRKKLIDILKNLKNVHFDEYNMSSLARINYLDKLRSYSLVPCPEGNGIDTHRLWETLYMGGTPVVIRNNFLPKVLDELPVIQLNSWEELTDTNILESFWYKFQKTKFDFTPLKSSFWVKQFINNSMNLDF